MEQQPQNTQTQTINHKPDPHTHKSIIKNTFPEPSNKIPPTNHKHTHRISNNMRFFVAVIATVIPVVVYNFQIN